MIMQQNYRVFITYNNIHKMRALMKGNAAQYFEKKDKPTEDYEAKINKLEAKIISKYIGVDDQEISQFEQFFDQIAKIKLPKGYRRYVSSDKATICYVNQQTGQEQYIHPSIDIIKVNFYRMLSDASKVYTFGIKSSKLLPFVEQKMIKQCIGLSSKRRDAQKANIQKDQNGKVIISKLARIKPDLKGLISARSYMLKALVEKIYTKKQLWGRGKRTSAFAAILAAQKRNSNALQQLNDDEQQNEQSLELYESIFTDSKNYYYQRFGNLLYIPQQLKQTKQFMKNTPESVMRSINILNIEKSNLELYWLARLMECLPLAPNWSRKVGDTYDKFFYEPKKLYFDIHPSYIYIIEQIAIFKQEYNKMDSLQQNYYNGMKEMVFYDFFDRPYDVDLYAFVEMNTSFPLTKKKVIKKSQLLGKNDWMALQGIKVSELAHQNYILIEEILGYWGKVNIKQDNFTPAISPFGQIIWSNTVNHKTIHYCPHSEQLNALVTIKTHQMPKVQQTDLKKIQQCPQNQSDQLFKSLAQKRQHFLQHFIKNDPKPLSQPYNIPNDYNQYQFFDSVFISPFNLQSELKFDEGTEMPIWLQKVHAKQNKDLFHTLLNQNPQNFEGIKQKFSQYALQMIRNHEAEREDDIVNVISQIHNAQQLKKFISHINDIDSREQRKRMHVVGEEQDQMSLGSSISQIQIDEAESQPESSQDQLIQIQHQDDDENDNVEDNGQQKDAKSEKSSQKQQKISQVSKQSDDEQKIPQIYLGKIYAKSKQLDALPETELNKKLNLVRKQKILKHKFNNNKSSIKDVVNRLQQSLLNQQLTNKQIVLDRKKNLIISRFNSEHAPYKISPTKINHRNNKVTTAFNVEEDSQDFSAFKSQTSQLGNLQIEEDIRRYQSLNQKRRLEENNRNDEQKKQRVDDTKQTIQLMPIKRIKPDINDDPFLTHISKFKQAQIFRKTFNNFNKPNKQNQNMISASEEQKNEKDNLRKTAYSSKISFDKTQKSQLTHKKSMSNLKYQSISKQFLERGSQESQSKSNQNQSRLRKTNSVLSLSRNSLSPSKFPSKFNRVCMSNTATNLLGTEPIIRQGDLIVIEARKSLAHKGRGLETLISKKY